MPMLLIEFLYVGGMAFGVAFAAAFLLRYVGASAAVRWASGVGLGYISGHLALAGRAGAGWALNSLLQPRVASDWLPLGVLLALGVTVLASTVPRSWQRGVIVLAALISVAIPARLLAGNLAQQWSLLEKAAHLVLLAATLGLVWLLSASARANEQPRLRVVLTLLVSAGATVAVIASGSIAYGQLAFAITAAIAGAGLAALPQGHGIEGASGVVTFSLGSLIVLSCYFSRLTTMNAALLMIALALAGGRLPELAWSESLWRRALLRAAMCLLPLGAALLGFL